MRAVTGWPAPRPDGVTEEEYALTFDGKRETRLLVVPALFDEANKLRHLAVEAMFRLDRSGIDSFLIDLPGCNESTAPLAEQTLDGWRRAASAAAAHFRATHVLSVRAGALVVPADLPGWRYAPVRGRNQLRAMIRARTIAAQENGRAETAADIQAAGLAEGIELAGWQIGPRMFADLLEAEPVPSDLQRDIAQEDVGGGGLWLRAEPDHDPEQADAIAATIAMEQAA
ncbi:hypothetical protein [Qipengyuania sp. JC766]|uniref:hypothetical protein n=1 Tax=Qipengyuania sp. JC766 TaxID=3232139 RepID=UPI003459C20A